MDGTLSVAIQLVPLIQSFARGEAAIGVSDLEQFVYYVPGQTLDLKLKVGQALPPEGATRATLNAGGTVLRKVMPPEIHGIRYVAVGMAVKNPDGDVVGAVVAGLPMQLEDQLGRMAADLAAAMQQFAVTFESITEIAGNTGRAATSVEHTAAGMGESLKATGSMTADITRIADRTRLLGLNASIEAAHAGRTGAGFAVVAREIQALSAQSAQSVQRIGEFLSELEGHSTGLSGDVQSLRGDAERLRTTLAEAQAFIGRLAQMADTLQILASRAID